MNNKYKTIISLCDYSGAWVEPYRRNGYNVIQVDIKHGSDVRTFAFDDDVYGILAAPPCTEFSSSGAQYWKQKDLDGRTVEALAIVDACLRLVVSKRKTLKFWALENPVGRLKKWLGKETFSFNPCDFGDAYTKKTLIWGDKVKKQKSCEARHQRALLKLFIFVTSN